MYLRVDGGHWISWLWVWGWCRLILDLGGGGAWGGVLRLNLDLGGGVLRLILDLGSGGLRLILHLGGGGLAWSGGGLWLCVDSLGGIWAVGDLRSAGGDCDDLSLIDDVCGHGNDHGAEENSGSGNGRELHFDCCFW